MKSSAPVIKQRFWVGLALGVSVTFFISGCVPGFGEGEGSLDNVADSTGGGDLPSDGAADGPDGIDNAPDNEASESPEGTGSDSGSSGNTSRDTPTLTPVNIGETESCLPGSWYPDLEQWTRLRGTGLQADVVHKNGGFVLMIDSDLNVIRENYEFEYQIKSPGSTIDVQQEGERKWQLTVLEDGAVFIPDSMNDRQEQTISVVNGDETFRENVPPIVFDRFKMQCEGDEITLHNPFGKMRLGREH